MVSSSPTCPIVFLSSLVRSWYLYLFSLSFDFILGLLGRLFPLFGRFPIFVDYHEVWSSGRDYVIYLYLKIPVNFVSLIFLDGFLVVHTPLVRMVKFQFFAQFPMDYFPLQQLCLVLYFFALIYRIYLLYDWSFRFYHHITYICNFVASYLFLLLVSGFFWRCFVLLSEEILLLSLKVSLSHVQLISCEISLVCRLKYSYSCFSANFCFLAISVLMVFVLSVLFLVVVTRRLQRFFMLSSSRCIDASTLFSMLASLLSLSFLAHTVCLHHLWDVKPYASS